MSGKLTPGGLNYDVYEQEIVAILYCLKKLRHSLLGVIRVVQWHVLK